MIVIIIKKKKKKQKNSGYRKIASNMQSSYQSGKSVILGKFQGENNIVKKKT